MKALLIDREAQHPLLLPPPLTLIADSSITPPGRPVFLPDFADDWAVEFYFAVKISRLGKDISLKFAARYFDSFTVAMRLVPPVMLQGLRSAGMPCGVTAIFDNALTLGSWLPLPSDDASNALALSINNVEFTVESPALCAAQAVEAVSRYCTLKTGDIVMPFRLMPAEAVEAGSRFEVSHADKAILQVRLL